MSDGTSPADNSVERPVATSEPARPYDAPGAVRAVEGPSAREFIDIEYARIAGFRPLRLDLRVPRAEGRGLLHR